MEIRLNVSYKVAELEGWRSKDGIKIYSNIADDELVNCQIAKSLVDYLKKESVQIVYMRNY